MSEITLVIYIGPLHVCTHANVDLLVTHQLPLYTQFDDTEILGLSEDG